MSEKLNFSKQETGAENLRPAERFRVNVEDYPVFRWQAVKVPDGDNTRDVTWNIDQTLSTFVTDTANLIANIDGTATAYQKDRQLEKPDHVLYLDKSARPVSWLVNKFWDDFSEEKRPGHSYLNIDRLRMLDFAGIEHRGGYVEAPDGSMHRATMKDFKKVADNMPLEVFAGLRAQYIEGGVDTDDPEEIMKMPTILDGKNLLIVDEV